MAREVTPDEIRNVAFRTTLRGFDRFEVEEMLQLVADRIQELESEQDKLQARLADSPSKDLQSEFETVGREVASILQAAREAAESMRERASLEATRWRRESAEEAETTRREAAADAEALRRDAWVTGSELLEQAQASAEAMRALAERDVLTVMGEAEREAHRLSSGARREAEDLMRSAAMDAEKITAEAATRRDEIIDKANRQAATAQERARALENRRDELLEELENVRATLTRLEGSLEERREALDLTKNPPEPSSVRVVHPPAEVKKQWELGETVRVVHPDDQKEPDPYSGMAEEVSDQVARIQESEAEPSAQPDPELAPAPGTEADSVPDTRHEPGPGRAAESVSGEQATADPQQVTEPESGPEPEPQPQPQPQPQPGDDLEALFASLRGGDDKSPSPSGQSDQTEPRETTEPEMEERGSDERTADVGTDWMAIRDSKLLPVTNRALRGVKKAMTEVQNVVLDSLRTDDDWTPDESSIAESVHAELVAVWTESFAAGHAVAEEMDGERLKRPSTPASHADAEFASDLAGAVAAALDRAGDGPRERQAAASRVFRVWRSDEAERRIRDIALLGYETGIEKSRSVTTG